MQEQPRKITLPLSREEAGFPPGEIVRTAHNPSAGITAVELRVAGSPPLHKVYWRRAHDVRYVPLEAGANVSCEDLVTAEAVPLLFVRLVEWKPQNVGYGGFTRGLAQIDAEGQSATLQQVNLDDALPNDSRLSKLLRINDSGTMLHAIVIFNEARENGGKRALYKICAIDLVARQTVELDTLPGVSF